MRQLVWRFATRLRRIYFLRRQAKRLRKHPPAANLREYNAKPRLSALIQLFNKRDNIGGIVTALIQSDVDEIIVLDDGSSDGALEILPGLLTGKNHFVIRSNDLFEVRTYSRGLDFARGEIVALLQDDDLPPADGAWVRAALDLFDRFPRLAVLGGRDGLELQAAPAEAGALPKVTYRMVRHRNDAGPDTQFDFVDVVNRAPMFLRREAIQRLGGIDNAFAPFQCDDVDICLRAWKAGLHVGVYSTNFVRDVGLGGIRLYNAEKLGPQAEKNWTLIADRYYGDVESGFIATQVAKARKDAGM
jgi:glycosyltransferase involved in cell wall biosynthesis